jgi:hypothetical protein
MANINLATQGINTQGIEKKSIVNGGLVAMIVVFVLIIAAYAGLLFLGNEFSTKAQEAKSDYDLKYNSFVSSDAKDVVDFQNRLTNAKTLVSKGTNLRDIFSAIEKIIIPREVYLGSFGYDEKTKTVTLDCVGNNFDIVARQILSFKGSDYFSSVTAGKTAYNSQNGKINFQVNLKLK